MNPMGVIKPEITLGRLRNEWEEKMETVNINYATKKFILNHGLGLKGIKIEKVP